MNYKEIQSLIETVSSSQLHEVEIEWEGFRIIMKKENSFSKKEGFQLIHNNQDPVVQNKENVIDAPVETQQNSVQFENTIQEGTIISSPMVGTFYGAPDPNSPPFVQVGDRVKKGDILCIIEAMKLMNEIDSDMEGEVVEIFVENEQFVEYGQPLFRICS
ncbi:MAG: acetyl-CoA carboxylase biotin carboxyl carrier protein [Epulopiscium sp.]|nr:acetyl-CoA carboxylase biotin carboxyl carrier protein [Candidatus Epulonipiscium sp.]